MLLPAEQSNKNFDSTRPGYLKNFNEIGPIIVLTFEILNF